MKERNPIPPRYARRLLMYVLRPDIAEEVMGDLDEKFYSVIQKKSLARARLDYWYQVFHYLRPFAIRRKSILYFNDIIMFRHYSKIAFRNMLKDKSYFMINTFGLALSMFCAMLVILWISDELSYEKFFSNSERVYRLVQDQEYDNGEIFKVAANPGILPIYLKDNYPGIEAFTRFRPSQDKILVRNKEVNFYESVTYVDSTFFTIFQLPFLKGNPDKALMDPNSIVITERMAEKYFGAGWKTEEVLGKMLSLNNSETFAVTGIIENLPANTHFKFDFLIPIRKLYQYGWYLDWGNNYFYAYFLLEKGADPQALSAQFQTFAKTRDDLTDKIYLQALEKIHLYSDFDIDVYGTTELQYPYVNIFMAVAFALILIACINFTNLSTARSEKRAKEIGLRKAIGSQRKQIIFQLLSESVFITILAWLLALAAVGLVLPAFNNIADKSIVTDWDKLPLVLSFFGGAVFIGIVAGSYSAFYLSGFRPTDVLKGRFKASGGTTFRRSLVVVQFAVTIILLLGTGIIYKQFRFFMEKDLGYDKELLVYASVQGDIMKNYQAFRNELANHPQVNGVTVSSDIPTYTVHSFGGFEWEGKNPDDDILLHSFSVGLDYFETLGIEMKEGRTFSADFPSDTTNYILNEEALRLTGLKSPIGQWFTMWGRKGKIVGIAKDFNFKSLHQKVEPLVLRMNPAWDSYIIMKIAPGNTVETLGVIEKVWKKNNPAFPFEYHFMNEQYESLYKSERRMAEVFDYFTFFTMFIACIGLIGLISHMVEKRKREISIRKVHGASVSNILALLSGEYVRLILIAIVISLPVAGYFVYDWLQNYAYRIEIQWWMFLLPAVFVMAVALLLVGGQTIKAARQNPVDNLRYE